LVCLILVEKKRCYPGWQHFNDYCYYFEYQQSTTWFDAEEECVKYGGHLTSILNEEENEFIYREL